MIEMHLLHARLTLHLMILIILESLASAEHYLGTFDTSNASREAEIAYFDTAVFIDKNVGGFKISMENISRVKILY
jgi:hypothetical protein